MKKMKALKDFENRLKALDKGQDGTGFGFSFDSMFCSFLSAKTGKRHGGRFVSLDALSSPIRSENFQLFRIVIECEQKGVQLIDLTLDQLNELVSEYNKKIHGCYRGNILLGDANANEIYMIDCDKYVPILECYLHHDVDVTRYDNVEDGEEYSFVFKTKFGTFSLIPKNGDAIFPIELKLLPAHVIEDGCGFVRNDQLPTIKVFA